MNGNGTDRDVAIEIASAFSDIKTALQTINDNLYVPHITVQPTDVTAAIGTTATFTITANNVKTYRWQYNKNQEHSQWNNTGAASTNPNYSTSATEEKYAWSFRCQVTGLNDQVIYSDVVQIIQPE